MARLPRMTSRSKYKNIKTVVDGITFASKKEATRYTQLMTLQNAGKIRGLQLQPRIALMVNGQKIGYYIGDFQYELNGQVILEDVKSTATKTPVYNLKKKILATYDPPIHISEV